MRATVDLAPLGYIPGASALTVVGDEVRKLKERAESAKYKEDVVYLLDRERNLRPRYPVLITKHTCDSCHG